MNCDRNMCFHNLWNDIPDNEEAIKKIVELCEYKAYNYTVLTDEVIKKIDNKALYKAIEALKNEPFLIDALHKAHAEIKEMERPQNKWIPIKTRPLTEEEKEEYPECSFMYDCQLPDDGEEVLITTSNGYVVLSTLHCDNDGCYCDLGYDCIERNDVVAWQPLPKPYKEADNEY